MNKLRRKNIQEVIDKLTSLQNDLESLESDVESIQDEEIEYRDNMPENLQGSERYEQADSACDSLETARDGLADLKDSIDETVFPDLYDKELQDSYGVMTPEDLVYAMVDDAGEMQDFQLWMQKFQGFTKSLDEKVDEAKN